MIMISRRLTFGHHVFALICGFQNEGALHYSFFYDKGDFETKSLSIMVLKCLQGGNTLQKKTTYMI
jgi:hypothetical protein